MEVQVICVYFESLCRANQHHHKREKTTLSYCHEGHFSRDVRNFCYISIFSFSVAFFCSGLRESIVVVIVVVNVVVVVVKLFLAGRGGVNVRSSVL